MKFLRAVTTWILNISSGRGFSNFPGKPFSIFAYPDDEEVFFLHWVKISHVPVCVNLLWSFHCALSRRVRSIFSLPSPSVVKLIPLCHLLLGQMRPILSASTYIHPFSCPLNNHAGPPGGSVLYAIVCLGLERSKPGKVLQWVLSVAE